MANKGDKLPDRRDVHSVGGNGTLVSGDGTPVSVDFLGMGGCWRQSYRRWR